MYSNSLKASGIPIAHVNDVPEGLLLLDKPAGVTSFDCVQRAKRALKATRAGHCGTLDPSARGLLLILIGRATKSQDAFHALDKEYRLRARFGVQTTTADLDGKILQESPAPAITPASLEGALSGFRGSIFQVPPLYSALKYKGKPYYHYARRGLKIPRQARPVTIYSISLLSYESPDWEALVVCSRGTYIRTLVEDIAARFGSCATLTALVRERIGSFKRQEALSWDALGSQSVEDLRRWLRPAVPAQLEPVHG